MAPMEGLTDFTYRNAYEKTFGKGRITKYFTPFIPAAKKMSKKMKQKRKNNKKNTCETGQIMLSYRLVICKNSLLPA